MLKEGKIIGSVIWAKAADYLYPNERGVFTNYEHNNKASWFSDRTAMLNWIEEIHPDAVLVARHDVDYEMWDLVEIVSNLIEGVRYVRK